MNKVDWSVKFVNWGFTVIFEVRVEFPYISVRKVDVLDCDVRRDRLYLIGM